MKYFGVRWKPFSPPGRLRTVINVGTDKNRYALNISGIAYRRFLLRFCTQSGRLVLRFLLIELRNYANTLTN